jgi:hypothetical protein
MSTCKGYPQWQSEAGAMLDKMQREVESIRDPIQRANLVKSVQQFRAQLAPHIKDHGGDHVAINQCIDMCRRIIDAVELIRREKIGPAVVGLAFTGDEVVARVPR